MKLAFIQKRQWESSFILIFFFCFKHRNGTVLFPIPRVHLFNQGEIYQVDEIWKSLRKQGFTAQCLLGQISFMKDGPSNVCHRMTMSSDSGSLFFIPCSYFIFEMKEYMLQAWSENRYSIQLKKNGS